VLSEIDLDQLDAARAEGGLVLDVRDPDEYEAAHVPGARLVPLSELPGRLDEVPKGEPVSVICQHGSRSMTAAQLLDRQGYDARSVAGGTSAWQESGRPVDTGPESA